MPEANDWNKKVIEEFRAKGGQVDRPLLLLHTVGAKSGRAHLNPVAYTRDGDHLVIIASNNARPTNPDWYLNLLAHPQITVEVGAETFPVIASVPGEPERTRLFDQMAAVLPGFGEYRTKTTRQIPVVVLTRTH